jgi:putative ABC transport system permease protein
MLARPFLAALSLLRRTVMDLHFAWRNLTRNLGFSALVILTLALGIGATTTMFSAVWAVLLRPLPLPAQDRLVTVWQADSRSPEGRQRLTPANFVDWSSQTSSFEALGVLPNWTGEPWPFNVAGPNGMDRVTGLYASSGFFSVMGVAPMLGRTFGADEDLTQGKRTVVLSHSYWQAKFGRDPSVVGKTLHVDTFRGGAFTVIGVMPAGFDFPQGTNIWLSLGDWGGGPMPAPDASNRCCPWYTVLGRLKPDVTIEHARAELQSIAQRVSLRHPDGSPATDVRVVSLREVLVGNQRRGLMGLFGAVVCVLIIGCANVANLLLSRGVGRRREVLTRLALGATRWRLARQLLSESLLLGAFGASLGLLLSLWGQYLLASAMADRVPLIDATHLDWVVLAFCVVLTLVVCTVCGLIPLIDWRAVDWNARGQSESPSSRRIRHSLVVGEVALAVTVVASAGLLLRTVANLRAVDVGFETARTLVVSTDLTTSPLQERGASARFVQDIIPRIKALPGVQGAAASTGVPFEAGPAGQAITRYGDPVRAAASSPQVVQSAVTPDYFRVMGITLTQGRLFTEDDRADARLVAVINATAARRYWPGDNPIGKRFAVGSGERSGSFRAVKPGEIEWREIVGVVTDIRSGGFASDVQPEVYYCYKQFPLYDPALVVRTAGEPGSVMAAIRRDIQAANSQAVITNVRTLEDVADESIVDPRLRALLATIFSALALALGMLGIYGVTSYTVEQRTREIGIRVALGARRHQVATMIMVKALRLAGIGAGLGIVGAYLVARGISSLFFGVSASDPFTLAAACLLLLAAAAVATVYPARRALSVDPADALRAE